MSFVGCHMDVVTANPETWSFDPFKLTVDGDKLCGRGTTDCLGHVALLTELFRVLGSRRPRLQRTVVGVFIANEENSKVRCGSVLMDHAWAADGLLGWACSAPDTWRLTAAPACLAPAPAGVCRCWASAWTSWLHAACWTTSSRARCTGAYWCVLGVVCSAWGAAPCAVCRATWGGAAWGGVAGSAPSEVQGVQAGDGTAGHAHQ